MEEVIEAANDASREHPMRVIVLMIGRRRRRARASTRRSASAATPARARSSRSARSARPAARTSRASSPACSCPTPPSSCGGRTRPPRSPSTTLDRHASPSAGSRMPRPSPIPSALGRRARRELRARRHRSRLDAPHALARAARRGARPAAVRARDRRRGARGRRTRRRRRCWRRGCACSSTCRWTGRTSSRDEWAHGIKSVRLERAERRGRCSSARAPASAILTQPGQPDARPRASLAAPCASASPRSSGASIPTSCMVE